MGKLDEAFPIDRMPVGLGCPDVVLRVSVEEGAQ